MSLKTTLCAALVASALSTPAMAQDTYVSLFGGFGDLDNPTFSGIVTPPGGPQTLGADIDTGFNFGVAVGRSFGNLTPGARLRGEIELSYSEADISGFAFSGNGPAPEVNVSGDFETTRLFGNLLVDFKTGSAFTPYVGAGLGIARIESNGIYGPGVRLQDTTEAFSAQLIAGTSYALSDRLSLTGDVRYIRDFDVGLQRFSPAGGLTGVVEDDLDTLSVNIGIRFSF